MNTYLLSFFLRLDTGEIRAGTQTIIACGASDAIMILHALPLPGEIVGAVTWCLIGPKLPRLPVPLDHLPAVAA